MHTSEYIDTQVTLNNLNTNNAEQTAHMEESSGEESRSNPKQETWRFLNTLSPSIKVDEDEHGSLIFRRFNYGIVIKQ